MKRSVYIFFLIFFPVSVFCQQKTQVVTRQFERTLTTKSGDFIEVKGEKAHVTIETHDNNEIILVVKFSARHPDRNIAENELNYMRYTLQQRKNRVYIDNYFSIPRHVQKVNSNLQVELLFKVPANIAVNVSNYFGSIFISNLSGQLTASVEYGILNLENCGGEIHAAINFSEFKIRNCRNIYITGNNSNINASVISGQITFKGENTDIEIQTSGTLSGNIDVKNGDIKVSGIAVKMQSLELISSHGELEVPEPLEINGMGSGIRVLHQPGLDLPMFKATSTFGKIQIR